MICKNCGAQFQDSLPKCPYCETLHYAGARKEYMEKLEDMKDDLSELHEVVPELYNEQLRTQTKNIKKTIFRVFIVLGIFYKDSKIFHSVKFCKVKKFTYLCHRLRALV